jgi:hypothetical protein
VCCLVCTSWLCFELAMQNCIITHETRHCKHRVHHPRTKCLGCKI